MSFERLVANTQRLSDPKYIEGLLIKVLKRYEPEMIDLNTGQLEEGLYSTGKKMDGYASIDYEKFKASIGSKSLPSRDQKVTGDFYAGWNIIFKSDFVLFDSNDSKTTVIVKRDGEDVFGLTNKSVSELLELGVADDFVNIFEDEFLK